MEGSRRNTIIILAAKDLPKRYIEKYDLSKFKRIILKGYKVKHGKLIKSDSADSVTVNAYHADEDVLDHIKTAGYINIRGEGAYFVNPSNKWWLLLIPLIPLIGIALCLAFSVGGTPGVPENPFTVVGEEKEIQNDQGVDNIIYQGFPASFEINSNVRMLSVQNDMANKDKFYTGVRLIENDEVIYDMGDSLLEPGKYVNIDLYELLSAGEHVVTIVQYGYSFGDTVTQVAAEPSQTITITVKK